MSWTGVSVTDGRFKRDDDRGLLPESSYGSGQEDVALEDAEKLWIRSGTPVETANSETRRVVVSFDVEHQILGAEESVTVTGTELAAQTRPTFLHAGFGGSVRLGDRALSLQGRFGFSTAGSGNRDFTTEIGMAFRF